MHPLRRWSLQGLVFALALWHGDARACGFQSPKALEIVANPNDVTPPETPVARLASLQRGDDWSDDGGGCRSGSSVSSCDGSSFVRIEVSARDDVTAGSALGYVIETAKAPAQGAPRQPVLADATGQVFLLLSGDDDGESKLNFQLHVFAVDQAGNVSTEPAVVDVRDEGHDDGCQVMAGANSGALWTAAGMLALLLRGRRGKRPDRGKRFTPTHRAG
jgi:hypothetical protein